VKNYFTKCSDIFLDNAYSITVERISTLVIRFTSIYSKSNND